MSFSLRSTSFDEGARIPRRNTCDGEDISPDLSWTDVPEKTASVALIVDDPDAPRGNWVHWVLFDLPPTVLGLPEKVPSKSVLETGGVHGKNDFGKLGYGGPCPPSGTHRYFFSLSALDVELRLPPGSTREQVEKAMQGHVLAEARLTGKYSREKTSR